MRSAGQGGGGHRVYPVRMATELSRETHERLTAELEDLTTRGRVHIARWIERARELGDLRENGDYHAAKDEQGKMEARIRQLQAMLKEVVITEHEAAPEAVVIGCKVGLRWVGDDDVEHYLVGSIEERRDGVEILSASSTLGLAVLGKSIGTVVTYEAPNGSQLEVEIVEISLHV